MKDRTWFLIERFVQSPHVNLAVGLILLVTSLSEAWQTLEQDLAFGTLKGHHGLILYSVVLILKQMPEVFAGAERITVVKR